MCITPISARTSPRTTSLAVTPRRTTGRSGPRCRWSKFIYLKPLLRCMEKLDKKKLQKLSPAERLKKLREIEEAGKKELKEAESLIAQTLAEIKGPSSEGGSAPATDISQLFGG